MRVAYHEDAYWYDLGDWRAVRITAEGWDVVGKPPILFRHYQHQIPQVEPLLGGDLDPFLNLLNVRSWTARLLVKVYLVGALLCDIPLPQLLVHGEQGSAKSMFFKLLRALVDPSSVLTLAPPGNLREFLQLAAHHRTVFLDNLSSLPDWLSDSLCRLCTGEGSSKRELYTDDDDIVYNFRGLGGLNGINLVATRSDLLDRAIVLKMEAIASGERLPEKDIWDRFEEIHGHTLGAVFDALVGAIGLGGDVGLRGDLPRLADFAQRAVPIAATLGYEPAISLLPTELTWKPRTRQL